MNSGRDDNMWNNPQHVFCPALQTIPDLAPANSFHNPGDDYTAGIPSQWDSTSAFLSPSSSSLSSGKWTSRGSSSSTGDSSHHGSQLAVDAEFEEGSEDRMESIVSGLLRDEGRDYITTASQRPHPQLEAVRSGHFASCALDSNAIRSIDELAMQFENPYANGPSLTGADDPGKHAVPLRDTVRSSGCESRRFQPSEVAVLINDSWKENWIYHMPNFKEETLRPPLQANRHPHANSRVSQIISADSVLYCAGANTDSNFCLTSSIPPYSEQARVLERQAQFQDMAHEDSEYKCDEKVVLSAINEAITILSARAELTTELEAGLIRQRLSEDVKRFVNDMLPQRGFRGGNDTERRKNALMAVYTRLCEMIYAANSEARSEQKKEKGASHGHQRRFIHDHQHSPHARQQRTGPRAEHVAQHSYEPLHGGKFTVRSRPITFLGTNTGSPGTATTCRGGLHAVLKSTKETSFSPNRSQVAPSRNRTVSSNLEKETGDRYTRSAVPSTQILLPRSSRVKSRLMQAAARVAVDDVSARFKSGLHLKTPTRVSSSSRQASARSRRVKEESAGIQISNAKHDVSYSSFQTPPSALHSHDREPIVPRTPGSSRSTSDRSRGSPGSSSSTTVLIAEGAKSISIVMTPESSGGGGARNAYNSSYRRDGSTPTSADSGSLSPIRPRRPDSSGTDKDGAIQFIPVANPSVGLAVSNQGQFKTELCNNWLQSDPNFCPYGDHCRFAHGREELRYVLRHPRYKTVPCRMILTGRPCIYGDRCHFRHSLTTSEELSLISVVDVHDPKVHGRTFVHRP